MAYDPTKPISETNNPEGISGNVATTPTGAKVNVKTGALISGPISGASLAPAPAVDFQTPETSTFTNAGSVPGEPSGMIVPENPQDSTVQGMIDQLTQQNTDLAGEGAFRTEQIKAQDLEGLTKTQDDLLSQLNLLKANEVNIPLQIEKESAGRSRTFGGVAPLTTARLRENAINANIIGAQLAGVQGKIGTALKLVDAAVSAKYDPKRADKDATIQNLELIMKSPEYTRAEKARADAQLRIQKREQTREETERQNFEDAQKLILQYPQATPEARAEMNKAKTAVEVQGIAAKHNLKTVAEKQAELNLRQTEAEIATTGTATITNPQAQQYKGALDIILGSGKFTKEQKASVVNAINGGSNPFTVVKNQAKNLLGQTGDTKLTNYEVAKGQLDAVEGALQKYYAAGGSTGILTGNYESVINKLGEVSNPKLVELATQISSALQIYRNAVSGTAYSVQEGIDIAKIFPGINKSQGLNKAILNGRRAAFDSTIDETYRSVLGSAYDELKTANVKSVSPENKTTALDNILNSEEEQIGELGFFDKFLNIFGLKKK